ncbi:MAG: hypothetical protein LBN07_03730 [Christensenellaceae bacterium]|jgi:hypothetical protein|nr:hypothetical protein [Christensenellaceae bacterium]
MNEQNDFFLKLPHNKLEFAIFVTIVSIISVNLIAPTIACFELGFDISVYLETLKILPFIWAAVVIMVLITYPLCEFLTKKIVRQGDSFRTVITINTLVTVLVLSILLTIVCTWIGARNISIEPLINFHYKWPRNFTIALIIELLIAQPFARFILSAIHKKQAKSKS